ncbi:MAG: ribokinase [Cetobacterium sp.]|nr:ribokinase [Cetobacterium sp.]
MKKILVVGSINMDLVTICERSPKGGETLFGKEFLQIPGGKGANQAVTIGKLNGKVFMLGKVGNDSLGETLLESLKNNNVNIKHIEKVEDSSGIAKIIVEENGENRILVVPGANGKVDINFIEKNIEIIETCDYIVAQLEIPVETVEFLFKKAKSLNKTTILNPAPGRILSREIIEYSDFIIPNESELELLTGLKTNNENNIKKAGNILLDMGVKGLLITMGSKGSLYMTKDENTFYPAYKVKALDTTAAGDSFIGGFVTGLSKGLQIKDAINLGTKVAAISVTRRGAQTSLPTLDEVIAFKGEK